MGFTDPTKVKSEQSTSSPGRTPSTRSATCRAAVPVEQATAKRAPTRRAKVSSNSPTNGPTDDTKPDSTARST